MMRVLVLLMSLGLLCGCNQNTDVVRNGEMLADAPKVAADPGVKPLAGAIAPGGESAMGDIPPFVKAYFMQHFVAALYSIPTNRHPNPNWSSPLKDSENGRVWCTDCHMSTTMDFTKIPKQEKSAMVEQLENNHDFMVGLMTKWVGRLNSDEFGAKTKLKGPVTCTTCHATDPREE